MLSDDILWHPPNQKYSSRCKFLQLYIHINWNDKNVQFIKRKQGECLTEHIHWQRAMGGDMHFIDRWAQNSVHFRVRSQFVHCTFIRPYGKQWIKTARYFILVLQISKLIFRPQNELKSIYHSNSDTSINRRISNSEKNMSWIKYQSFHISVSQNQIFRFNYIIHF